MHHSPNQSKNPLRGKCDQTILKTSNIRFQKSKDISAPAHVAAALRPEADHADPFFSLIRMMICAAHIVVVDILLHGLRRRYRTMLGSSLAIGHRSHCSLNPARPEPMPAESLPSRKPRPRPTGQDHVAGRPRPAPARNRDCGRLDPSRRQDRWRAPTLDTVATWWRHGLFRGLASRLKRFLSL